MILVKEDVWLSLEQVRQLLREGSVRTQSSDLSEINLHILFPDAVAAKKLGEERNEPVESSASPQVTPQPTLKEKCGKIVHLVGQPNQATCERPLGHKGYCDPWNYANSGAEG